MGTVLVARGDEVLFEGRYGFADVEHQVEHTRASVFRIGSLTEQFTAAAVLDLADRGLVQLDDPLARCAASQGTCSAASATWRSRS